MSDTPQEVKVPRQVIEQVEAVILELQWGFNFRRCSLCAGWNMGPNGETDFAHTKDCPVPAALSALREVVRSPERCLYADCPIPLANLPHVHTPALPDQETKG